MIAFLTKSDTSEGFEQIVDFLNTSVIQYALMVNPTIYVSFIKQFWSSVSFKQINDVVRLQALIDRRKVIITEDTVRQTLRLDDADSIDCLPNEEIFAELARMGSSMASAVICLATGRKFNFLKYIFDNLVRNVDSPSKFYMYPRFLQLMIIAQVGDLASHTTKYTSSALTQKVFANMRRVDKGFSRVDTLLFDGMLVPHQVHDVADDVADDVVDADAEPTSPSPTPATTPPPQQELILLSSQVESTLPPSPHQSPIAQPSSLPPQQPPSHDAEISMALLNQLLETYADGDVTLEEVDAKKDAEETDEAVLAKVEEVLEVVTAAKLMTEVVTTATTPIIVAPVPKASAPRRRRGVIIQDPEEAATASLSVQPEVKSKDKGKGILVEEPKPLKRQAQIEHDEAYARELEAELNANINWNEVIEQVKRKEKQDNLVMRYQALKRKHVTEAQARKNIIVYLKNMAGFKMIFFKGMSYTDIRPIFEKHFNSNWTFLKKGEKEIKEEESKLSKRKSENLEQEDLEMLWKIVQERFASLELKNFSDDFLLNALKTMFEKPNVEANIWKNQRGIYGLAKVKSWKLLESCGVYIITFITTQMILLVERRYPLTGFTLNQMLNNVRLEVEEESDVSLELLRFVRRQLQEGYKPDFGVDAVEDFKEYMLRDYYCWLKSYCCWYKLKLLDNAAGSS
uniref:Reverse transcriptase domain-containing protein n=1 Tax=Tanacetum cinerariifolium TaxID=118510 RepID=A0A6L2J1N7_TANCI|nr:reverse transcriptase domain-containing protein [Tanacetum cinerariifolium]